MPVHRFILPIKGLNERLPVEDAEPATTFYLMNVRVPGALERQIRIAQRPGLDKWSTTRVSGTVFNPVVEMTYVDVPVL